MYGYFDLWDKVKRYFRFTPLELRSILIVILIFTFITTFNKWGGETFDAQAGIQNLVLWGFIIAISVVLHISAQKIVGLHNGFRVEFSIWWYGLLLGIILAFVTKGALWLLLPGGITLYHMSTHRLGYFRYGTNYFAVAMAALAGALANILLATFIKTFEVWFGVPISDIELLNNLVFFNWMYALLSLLPFPPLDGWAVLFNSRLVYAFIFGSIAGYGALILLGIYSFVFALLIGGIIWLLFFLVFERGLWKLIS